jgi:hypothetical protein
LLVRGPFCTRHCRPAHSVCACSPESTSAHVHVHVMLSCTHVSAARLPMYSPRRQKNDLELSPISVQVIYLLVPLSMAICSGVAEKAARRLGRVTVLIACKTVGSAPTLTCASSHLRFSTPALLHTCASSHLRFFTPALLHTCASPHLRLSTLRFSTPAPLHTCTPSSHG